MTNITETGMANYRRYARSGMQLTEYTNLRGIQTMNRSPDYTFVYFVVRFLEINLKE